ncbi:NAD(P)H-dependent oxidoreductase [Methanolobus profundi]|uniref:Putative NADPH-quinone reductase (Modulator of drug activity B) n=1 Tax=Methanolobus profundi TaxID=487685 RepID=A0A1I4PE35_9EURY|nr:NAD(P)H-dependent oxidoreductase [Methanolobus profundi]SFM25979.1 Putative NADPH-quinone reductase (modulator of drug activity B) [Methanolobus profundi]
MKVSVILGHPYEKSFNHAIANVVMEALLTSGHEVHFHDLHKEGFDPLLRGEELVADRSEDPLVRTHWAEIREADGIIIVHPNWWGQPPAILKGWLDRVLREGVAYMFPDDDDGSGLPIGLLKAKAAIVLNTSNTPEERENNVFGDPLERIWKDCVFDFCGVTTFHRRMFRTIAGSSSEEREEWLDEVRDIVNDTFPQLS